MSTKVTTNPTRDQAVNLIKESTHQELRALYNPATRELHVWDYPKDVHASIAEKLGVNQEPNSSLYTHHSLYLKLDDKGSVVITESGGGFGPYEHQNIFSGEDSRIAVRGD